VILTGEPPDVPAGTSTEGKRMPVRTARTAWDGGLQDGSGQVELTSSGTGTFDVSFPRRTAEGAGGVTSPEELIAAAHAACFAMALSNTLAKDGHAPEELNTSATVTFQPGEGITRVALTVEGTVPGLDEDAFRAAAQTAKENCPVSKALAAVPEIGLDARLAG
jgi:osmotically inducible protein OsmC